MSVASMSHRRTIMNLALLLLLLVFLMPVMKAWSVLAGYWGKFSETYAHGYMVLACTFYLLYERHQKDRAFSAAASKPETLLAVLACVGIGALFVVADYIQVRIVMLLLMPALLFVWVYGVFGARAARAALIPIGLLYTAIPFWEILSVPLRVMAVSVTDYGLGLLQVPAYIDGFKIELAYGVLEVAHGCSGLVYLLTSLALSIIMAALHFSGIKKRVLVVVAACIVGVVANWVRIYSLVLIAHYSQMQNSLVYDHEFYGWVVYLIFFGIYMYCVLNLPGKQSAQDAVVPEVNLSARKTRVAAALLLSVSLVVTTLVISQAVNSPHNNTATATLSLPGFRQVQPDGVLVRFSGYDLHLAWLGKLSGLPVRSDLLLYLQQRQGKELAYYLNDIALPEELVARAYDHNGFNVRQLHGGAKGRIVAWQYRVGQQSTTQSLRLKLLEAWQGLTGDLVSGLYTISYQCSARRCSDAEWENFRQLDLLAVAASLDVIISEVQE